MKGLLKRMKEDDLLPERAGQASFRKHPARRQGLKDAHCLAITTSIVTMINIVSAVQHERFHLHHYYHV